MLGESTKVRRLLPNLGRRLVGPWCFIDHYGPDEVAGQDGMRVPPHPHIGLQTVSWLLDGTVHHQDSLGSDQVISPGTLGIMTAGRGIVHAENSPVPHPALLHGVQLWVALPEASKDVAPQWQFTADLPRFASPGMEGTVFVGSLDGARSPGTTFSPQVGVDIALTDGADELIPLEPEFEYTVLALDGAVEIGGTTPRVGSSLYLGRGRRELRLQATSGPVRLMLLGGAPFEEQIVMWWNFVGRSTEEIAEARAEWMAQDRRFGIVGGYDPATYDGAWMPAPELPAGRLKPGGAARERKQP
jgi:redox-sensitive bicupin YhaK (pirin superfamily)